MALGKQTVRGFNVTGKTVLVRCDFNVPLSDGKITDDRRITESLPTIKLLLDQGASIVLTSHLGRPKGITSELSLAPVAARLNELLTPEVVLILGHPAEVAEAVLSALEAGKVVLLENIRFYPEEEANDPAFAKSLANLAQVFVNDAFGTAHRAHASTEGVAHLLPAVAGLLIEKELKFLGEALEDPKRPLVGILGGAKIKDKLPVIGHLVTKVDHLIIGGGMAFTFLKAKGLEIGTSLLDESNLDFCREMLAQHGDKLVLPLDAVVTSELSADASTEIVSSESMPAGKLGADIGPESVALFTQLIKSAGTVIWNGPMGVFEMPPFENGTKSVALALAESDAITIVGGGDSAAAIEKFDLADRVTHVSTGGGASLEFLEGKALPGIAALLDA